MASETIEDILKEQSAFTTKMKLLLETTTNEHDLDELEDYKHTQTIQFAERYFISSARFYILCRILKAFDERSNKRKERAEQKKLRKLNELNNLVQKNYPDTRVNY